LTFQKHFDTMKILTIVLLWGLSCSAWAKGDEHKQRRKVRGDVRSAAADKRRSLQMGDTVAVFTFSPIALFPTVSPYPSEAPVTPSPTPDPTPLPTVPLNDDGGEDGFVICFSSESTVQVKNRGIQRMDELQLGDKILTKNGMYEPIYSFGHYDQSAKESTYLQLLPSKIEISPLHLIFVQSSAVPIPAGQLQIGDVLVSGQAVTGIRSVKRRGAYAPFTKSGTLLVNGQLASSFISLQGKTVVELKGGWSTGISHHWAGLIFEAPHRLFASYVSFGDKESYTAEGISTWVAAPREFFTWLLVGDETPSLFWQCILLCPILGFFGSVCVLEWIMTHSYMVVATLLFGCGTRRCFSNHSLRVQTRKLKSK